MTDIVDNTQIMSCTLSIKCLFGIIVHKNIMIILQIFMNLQKMILVVPIVVTSLKCHQKSLFLLFPWMNGKKFSHKK